MKDFSRHTKIIFTIGPATAEREMLTQLLDLKVDICRINMAHADFDWIRNITQLIRELGEEHGRNIPIMMDIKGPEIRTGNISEPVYLDAGTTFNLHCTGTTDVINSNGDNSVSVNVNYKGLLNDLHEGDTVLIDNGMIELQVMEKHTKEEYLRTEVKTPGLLKSKRHINLPGIKTSLPSLTSKDIDDLALAIELNHEFIAQSFVREASDIQAVREILKKNNSEARIIAKIEDQCALSNIDSIIQEADGVMVARGDLGVECPYDELPIIQKKIVNSCTDHHTPVIVATHMLESMIEAPYPTRAEVSDISNAIFEQADAIMLSGETTIGKYPLKCVEVMNRVSQTVEQQLPLEHNTDVLLNNGQDKMLRSAVVLAQELTNTGIVAFTRGGISAKLIASLRPKGCPLFMFTDNLTLSKQLRLLWGVEPFYLKDLDSDDALDRAINILKNKGFVRAENYIIALNSTREQGIKTPLMKLKTVS